MNATSSRSHVIFTIKYERFMENNNNEFILTNTSLLRVVDLAGSERHSDRNDKVTEKEMININKTLFNLRKYIMDVSKHKNNKIEVQG